MRFGTFAAVAAVGMASIGPAHSVRGQAPAAVPVTHWQLPDEAIGIRLSPILLLSRPDVREELGMSGEQAAASSRAIAAFAERAAALRGHDGPEAVAARRAVDEAAGRWIEEHLTAEQRDRLAQLDLQWQGASALLSRPTIGASLELTEEQRRRIGEAIARGPVPGEGPIEAHHRTHRDAVAVLTEEQRLRWLAMVGSPFEPVASARPSRPVAPGG